MGYTRNQNSTRRNSFLTPILTRSSTSTQKETDLDTASNPVHHKAVVSYHSRNRAALASSVTARLSGTSALRKSWRVNTKRIIAIHHSNGDTEYCCPKCGNKSFYVHTTGYGDGLEDCFTCKTCGYAESESDAWQRQKKAFFRRMKADTTPPPF